MIDLPGEINGFKILEDYGYTKVKDVRRALVICKVCRDPYEVDPHKLKYRKHCGCMKKNVVACRYAKQYPRLAQTYKHMTARCYNKENKDYYNYGGRGIIVCEEWIKDRNSFCSWALKSGYKDSLSIDRIDGYKGYYPENCKWANAKEQARNTRRNVLTLEKAEQMRKEVGATQKELAEKYNVSTSTVWLVINNRIWKI